MKLEESYNLSQDKWFDRIKDESRSQAKKGLCLAAGVLLLSIFHILLWQHLEQKTVLICCLSVGCIASAWIVVNNLRFLKRLNIFDTPKELLYWYKKRLKNDRNALYLAMLGFLICDPSFWFDVFNMDKGWIIAVTMFKVLFVVAIIAVFILPYFDGIIVGELMTRRDEEIIDRLEDLVEKK